MRDTDRADSPRTRPRSQYPPRVWYSSAHRLLFGCGKQAGERFLPALDAVAHFILVHSFKDVAAQSEPGAVGIIRVHHFPPHRNGQTVTRLFVPWDGRHLQGSLRTCIEQRAAEEQAQRNLAIADAVKILGGGDVEIEGAGNLELRKGRAGEGRDHYARVSPQHGTQRAAPTVRSAE